MSTDHSDLNLSAGVLARGGLTNGLALWLGLAPPTPMRRLAKVTLLVLLTWLPLAILSILRGHAWRGRVSIPLMLDPVVHSRFLFVVPLLELAQIAVETSLRVQMRHFLDSGLIPERQRPDYKAAVAEITRLRNAPLVEVAIIVISVLFSLLIRTVGSAGVQSSNWSRLGESITPAGWWYILVSLPVLYFFLTSWLWLFLLWAWFLFRTSRLDLELTPTHPDRAGGLGFLGWGMVSFGLVVLAVSAVLSGSLAREILHGGSSLADIKYHVIIFVIIMMVILHAPLFVYTGRLARCRFRGLLDFGNLIWAHDHEFDEKWVRNPGKKAEGESLLGSHDVASLGAIARAFDHIDEMRLMPFDKKASLVLVVAAVLPMVPLLGTSIPLAEILKTLGEFLV
jgi:hypothetical protein